MTNSIKLTLDNINQLFRQVHWNLSPQALTEAAIQYHQAQLADNGALVVSTGQFTGRSPQDRFIVKDTITATTVDWGKINLPIEPMYFNRLREKMLEYLADKTVYVRDAYACADENYRLNIRLISEFAWSNQFAYNLFLRPLAEELKGFQADWTILCAPGFEADPNTDGIRKPNFAILNFSAREILIGGTAYTGEIKKGIFSVLNYLLPMERGVFPMHCSANVGKTGDTAIFFGLSGTGKTTLSADPQRQLVGDDEHGWSDEGVFNFEGGCYAKTIDLTEEKEPDIYRAIRPGAILENIPFVAGTRHPDYADDSITENTRVSYPIHHIANALEKSIAGHPKNIFFLTCDAFGVLPPISRLSKEQAMYYFISGYTAKVAGTEAGITEPEPSFSACFGAPFMPLHPTQYANMLGERMEKHQTSIWLVNTGWTGGPYGVGERIRLKYTRAMIRAALEGHLEEGQTPYLPQDIFGLRMPMTCPGVPHELLNPRQCWGDPLAYDRMAERLAQDFRQNFRKYEEKADEAVKDVAPGALVF
ncbi:MAG TPA: phosphoenolpyruvate carboxykinase (ATP) [Saprospiraceae bacterium]|nr:phosphoenolpyruvate carboxykinase (ATP) [Saprospiraceae bacterium]HMQ83859.1 phosphoenolpyruvate carboxykinase (ATP) [Saprospiraceae bacterium]